MNTSVSKGQRIVVTGRLRIRDWVAGEKTGTNIEVDADAVGHDLSWGTSAFVRNISSAPVSVPVNDVDPTSGAPATDAAAASSPADWGTSSLGSTWASQPPASTGPGDGDGSAADGSAADGDGDDDDDGDDAELDGAAAKASEAVPF